MNFHKDGTQPTNREIFVFGSNLAGRHGRGAAQVAVAGYGAIFGVGVGPQGNSYTIPTKDQNLEPLPLDVIKKYVDQFLCYANHYQSIQEFFPGAVTPNIKFFVTGVGCGLAGYSPEQIAPMFKKAPDNCSLPDVWAPYVCE